MSSPLDLFDASAQDALNRAILLAALVMARVSPVVQLVPYLGGKAVPTQVKAGLSLALAALVYPIMWQSGAADQLPSGALVIAALVLKEVMVGAMLGLVAALVFDAVRLAGQIMDTARGQNMATAMLPQLPDRVSMSADLLYQGTVVVFLMLGGHRLFIAALVRSFVLLPPHRFAAPGEHGLTLTMTLVRLSADAIALGVLIAFPVIAAVLLTDVCLALVNRAAPNIQVFFLGMPIKAMLGLAVLVGVLDRMVERIITAAAGQIDTAVALVQLLGGAQGGSP